LALVISIPEGERLMFDHGGSRDRRAAGSDFSVCRRFRPTIDAFLGILRCIIAGSMFVSLVPKKARRNASTSEFTGLPWVLIFPK
jgi:hypothetical protein